MRPEQADKAWVKTDNALRIIEKKLNPVHVRRTESDTNKLPVQDQFEFWRESTANIGLVERPDLYDTPFNASSVNCFTTTAAYSRHSILSKSSIERSPRYVANMGVDALAIQYRLSGEETANSFDHGRLFFGGDVRILDLSQPFSSTNLFYDNIGILVSKKDLMDRLPELGSFHGVTLPNTPITDLLKSHMVSVMGAVPKISQAHAEKISRLTLEMLSFTLTASSTSSALESESMNSPILRAVQLYISQHLGDPTLSPDKIARNVGVSRAKLFRVCKLYGTPMEMVRYKRLRRAMELLKSESSEGVANVAYTVGYENRGSFSRAFKNEFGFTAFEFIHSK